MSTISNVYVSKIEKLLNRYGCSQCGATKKLTVDHIIPISLNGFTRHIGNLDILCHTCNNKKDNQILHEYDEYYAIDTILRYQHNVHLYRYGKMLPSALIHSAFGNFDHYAIIDNKTYDKLIEYFYLYGLKLIRVPGYRMPIDNSKKYLRPFDPNYELDMSVIRTYVKNTIKFIT